MTWQPVLDALMQLIGMAVLAFGVALMNRLADWLRLAADDRVRGYLRDAMERAVAQGLALSAAQGGDQQAAIVHAVRYVETRVPDALRRLRIGPSGVRQMVEARLAERDHGTLF